MSALVDDSAPPSPDLPGPDPSGPVAEVEQDAPAPAPAELRRDFGAHFEANYRRLVAQLYAITLDAAEAHEAVQDAYSRAWRRWAEIGSSPDPSAWVRRVAVRTTARSWRRVLRRRARPAAGGVDARTAMLLRGLARLPAAERRCVVLRHMAGASPAEIAAVEGTSIGTTSARLRRAEQVLGDVLPELSAVPAHEGEPE